MHCLAFGRKACVPGVGFLLPSHQLGRYGYISFSRRYNRTIYVVYIREEVVSSHIPLESMHGFYVLRWIALLPGKLRMVPSGRMMGIA